MLSLKMGVILRERYRKIANATQKVKCNAEPISVAFSHIYPQLYQIACAMPTLRTEKDIGSENPETTTVSGFFRAFFQGGIQKISFPKNDLWGGLELLTLII